MMDRVSTRQGIEFGIAAMSKSVCIVCFDHFTDIDAFLPWDLLNRVRLLDDG